MSINLLDTLTEWVRGHFVIKTKENHRLPPPSQKQDSLQSEEWLSGHKQNTWQKMRALKEEQQKTVAPTSKKADPTAPAATTMPSPLATTDTENTEQSTERVQSIDPVHQEKLQALKRLRELPKGVNIDGRSAAIISMLHDNSFLFAAVRAFRWPELVTCPRCHSTRIKRRPVPAGSLLTDQWYYTCLNCQSMGSPADFDDVTNINLEQNIQIFRQWMACYYLLAFCSPSQLTKILGLSSELISRLMFISDDVQLKQKQEAALKEAEEVLSQKKKKQQNKTRK